MSSRVRFVVLGVLALSAAAVAVYALGRNGSNDGWKAVKNEPSGIALTVPDDWTVQTFGRYCRRAGPGLLVSNVRHHRFQNVDIPNGCTNQWVLEGLPDEYVLVDISLFALPRFLSPPEDTELPLELDRFQRPPGTNYVYTRIMRGTDDYGVRIWTGSNVSRDDEKALARTIHSIEVSGLDSD